MGRARTQKTKTNSTRKSKSTRPKAEKDTRGCRGFFTGEPLKALQEALPLFLSLPKRSKARTSLFASFVPGLLAWFPLETFELPLDTIKALSPLTQQQRDAMTPDEKKKRPKQERRRNDRSKEARFLSLGSDTKKQFELNDVPERPRRRQLRHYVATHPMYHERVLRLSKETCQEDRLRCRMDAAKTVIDNLSEEEKATLELEIDSEHKMLLEVYESSQKVQQTSSNVTEASQAICRSNLPRTIQPLLHLLQKYTGLNIMLTVGRYKGIVDQEENMFSIPDGAPEWDKYRVEEYKDFGRKWCSWSRAIHTFEQNQSAIDVNNPSSNNDAASTANAATSTNIAESSSSTKDKKRRRKMQSQEDEDLDDSEEEELSSSGSSSGDETLSEDDTPSGDETPSDDEAPSEDEKENGRQSKLLIGLCKPGIPTSAYDRQRADNIAQNRETLLALMAEIPPEEMPFLQKPLPKHKRKGKGKGGPKEPQVPTRSSLHLIKAQAVQGTRSSTPQLNTAGFYRFDDNDNDGARVSNNLAETTLTSVHDSNAIPSLSLPGPFPSPTLISGPLDRSEDSNPSGEHLATTDLSSNSQPPPDPILLPLLTSTCSVPPTDTSQQSSETADEPGVHSNAPSPLADVSSDDDDEEDQAFRSAWSDVETGGIGDSYYPLEACEIEWVRTYAEFLMLIPPGYATERPKEFLDCVYLWIMAMVEERWNDVLEHSSISQQHRVEGLKYWFKAHRTRMTKPPSEVVLGEIRNQFWVWLNECSPEWMEKDVKNCLLPSGAAGDGDFSSLVCPGTSGVVLLLVALCWWCDVGGAQDKAGFWYEATKCVHLLLAGLFIAP
ncbi:hypothetical protein VNI00_005799 [Paramarasmius palmivorus]|uniref:Uncharacterized protein n=1 Tax=Paramarasmius palmivorus TaxID=297713 RepID=A0AAW0DDZ5_9AGAR